MPALTRFVLRHKLVVALLWLAIAVAGVVTIGGTTHRMTNSFAMPGQAYRVNNQIIREYGNGGSQPPYVAVLTAPPGQRITSPAARAAAGRAFGALQRAVPGYTSALENRVEGGSSIASRLQGLSGEHANSYAKKQAAAVKKSVTQG